MGTADANMYSMCSEFVAGVFVEMMTCTYVFMYLCKNVLLYFCNVANQPFGKLPSQ